MKSEKSMQGSRVRCRVGQKEKVWEKKPAREKLIGWINKYLTKPFVHMIFKTVENGRGKLIFLSTYTCHKKMDGVPWSLAG